MPGCTPVNPCPRTGESIPPFPLLLIRPSRAHLKTNLCPFAPDRCCVSVNENPRRLPVLKVVRTCSTEINFLHHQ